MRVVRDVNVRFRRLFHSINSRRNFMNLKKKKKKLFLSNKEHEIMGFSTSEQELYSCIVSDMKKQKDHLFISAYLSLAVK